VNNCEWREKIGPYVDSELEPDTEQAIVSHLQSCSDCSAAVLEQQELKKAVRVAARRFTAPPDLYGSVRRQMEPKKAARPWQMWSLVAASMALFAVVAFGWYSRQQQTSTVAQLIDQHVTMLASANPVDVISTDNHVVKPWFQGKVPFTFNPPVPSADSPFALIGGKVVYTQNSPGAELVYKVRQHKLSVFIFQARDVHGGPAANQPFVVNSWQQGGLQYYIVTDAAKEDAEHLRSMMMEAANRQ